MSSKQILWVHPASYTYRLDKPENLLETIWCERPGWGYLRRRDLWIKKETSAQELRAAGFHELPPVSDETAFVCTFCGMRISSIPGSLVNKHKAECSGAGENWQALEETVINDVRMRKYEAKLAEARRREQEELLESERRERQDKIKEGLVSRQLQKDRKRRLKQETKEEWKNR
ncbi:MAG TPA: hypothetical protein VK463_15445 [Desulfomonilaceae bacterium]|nr:hypothetical protein [Desulfomonilaceae bacterium]